MIRVTIVGAEGIIKHLGEVPPRVLGLVRQAVEREAIRLTRYVKEQKLTGQVLKQGKTGHLRQSINYALTIQDQGLTAQVGTNLVYARIHEYGGTVTVREHTRRMTMAWGRKMTNPIQVSVRAHTAKYPERSYLRSSLRENEARIKAAIAAAVAQGVKG